MRQIAVKNGGPSLEVLFAIISSMTRLTAWRAFTSRAWPFHRDTNASRLLALCTGSRLPRGTL
jgi:hypothetical protein